MAGRPVPTAAAATATAERGERCILERFVRRRFGFKCDKYGVLCLCVASAAGTHGGEAGAEQDSWLHVALGQPWAVLRTQQYVLGVGRPLTFVSLQKGRGGTMMHWGSRDQAACRKQQGLSPAVGVPARPFGIFLRVPVCTQILPV